MKAELEDRVLVAMPDRHAMERSVLPLVLASTFSVLLGTACHSRASDKVGPAKSPVSNLYKASTDLASYLGQRSKLEVATTPLPVAPRWDFSPRKALAVLGSVRLRCAIPPTDTGALQVGNSGPQHYEHFGLTVWQVDVPASSKGLSVACIRLVAGRNDQGEDVSNRIPPWPAFYAGGPFDGVIHRTPATKDIPICGHMAHLYQFYPTCWICSAAVGGWAIYVNSGYRGEESAEAASLAAIAAMDLVTESLRTAANGASRPLPPDFKVTNIRMGNQEAFCSFSIRSSRGRQVAVNVWNKVPKQISQSGIRGYNRGVFDVIPGEWINGQLAVSCPWGSRCLSPEEGKKVFASRQLDWCDEFGVGAVLLHENDSKTDAD